METKWNQGKMPMTSTLTSMGILPSADNVRKKTKKVPDASHGLKFESKLLTLFCIRALEAGYKFEVTKEREDLGGKFDDVIFRYLVVDDTLNGKPWRYRYLQAKHRQEESFKINGTHLLEDNEKGHFSLPKYFRSFCKMRTRCEDIHDCILCTNGGFDLKDVQEKGIELVSINDQPEDILEFGPQQKTARYKLEFSKELRGKALCDWSDIDRLAKQLQVCAQDQTTTDIRSGVFSSYHLALVNEHVIDSATKTFHVDFLNNAEDLSNGAQHLRQTISNLAGYDWKKWKFELSNTFGKSQTSAEMENCLPLKITEADIDTYLDKVVFVVNMPNEKEFEDILQVEDVNKYYPREECSIQTVRLLHEMSAKFSNKVMGYWLTSEDAKKILLAGVTNVSQQYQEELENDMAFNEVAKQDMAVKLKDLLANNERIERIITRSPKHTAVKVVSAIHKLAEYNRNGSFLVVTLSSLEDKERWRNILKLKTDSHHLLIVVCDKETPDPCDYADLVPHDQINNKIMFICRDRTAGMMDEITYADMSEKFQNAILQKTISFQGTKLTVDELVVNEPDKVIDCLSIEELLLQEKKEINIPQPDTYDEESVYIKRWLTIAFNEAFDTKLANRLNCTIDELHEKCRITAQGEIKWLVTDYNRKSIWKEIKNLTDEGMSSNAIEESQLIRLEEGRERLPIVIISGVAGTGKSTILSHYYIKMKQAKPDHWIIRINLVEHQTAFPQLVTISENDAVDFFVKQLHIVANDSPFSRSLLRHRIKTGKRIAFMFDGFDEISHDCQQKVIRLMKLLANKKTIGLYVTTRPHMIDELQFELSQLAYHLQILAKNEQIDYLINYWQANLQEIEMENKSIIIKKFAEALAQRVSQTLRDEERAFIGVPLQCRILAECYQSEVEKRIENDNVAECVTFRHQNFDLKSLYHRLLNTKRRIFREEKAKSLSFNQIGKCAMDFLIDDIESHLTKLAIKTLVVNENKLNILWPSRLLYFQSATEKSEKENKITDLGVKYGLILIMNGEEKSKVQFVHRTYAEYFFAQYLHRGMDINNFDNNQLLDEVPVRNLVVNEILVEGNYHGVRVFLNSMLNKTEDGRRTNLPIQLKKFAEDLAQNISQPLPRNEPNPNVRHTNALTVALKTENLFHVLLDCLDGTLYETETKRVVKAAFQRPFDFSIFLHQSNSQLFQRVLSYYRGADAVDVERFVNELLHQPMMMRYLSQSYVNVWNNEEAKDVVKMVLDCMESHTTYFKQVLNSERPPFRPRHTSVTLLHFFIFNDYYNSVLSQCLRLLSSIYSEDNNFIELIKFTLNMHDYNNDNWTCPFNNGIEKTLDILRDLPRPRVMQGLCHLALVINVFEKYYLPDKEDSLANPPRMTRLHWAAFNGDVEAIESVCAETCSADDGFTPFYVAATRHHQEICRKILSSLKTRLTDDELRKHLTEYKGFAYTAMWDAICFHNLKMFQLILESVKQALGRHYLMALLRSEKPVDAFRTSQFHGSGFSILGLNNRITLFKIIATVLLNDGSQEGYTNLNDLVFHENAIVGIVLNTIEEETFHRMVDVNGLENWTKRFLDVNVQSGFRLLSTAIVRFTLNQRRQFINTITSPNIPTYQFNQNNISYWGKWFEVEFGDKDFESLDSLLTFLKDDVPKLIFHDNCMDAIKALLCQNSKLAIVASKYFSWKHYFKFKGHVMKSGPEVINELFTSRFTQKKVVRYWVNILPFYVGKKGKCHLRKLVESVLSLHTEKYRKKTIRISLWSKYLDSFEYGDHEVEKVDQFLKLVSHKLGKRAVRKIVLHKDCTGIVLLGAELQQNAELVNALLTHLSQEDRYWIQHLVRTTVFSSRRYTRDGAVAPCQCQPMNDCWCWY